MLYGMSSGLRIGHYFCKHMAVQYDAASITEAKVSISQRLMPQFALQQIREFSWDQQKRSEIQIYQSIYLVSWTLSILENSVGHFQYQQNQIFSPYSRLVEKYLVFQMHRHSFIAQLMMKYRKNEKDQLLYLCKFSEERMESVNFLQCFPSKQRTFLCLQCHRTYLEKEF